MSTSLYLFVANVLQFSPSPNSAHPGTFDSSTEAAFLIRKRPCFLLLLLSHSLFIPLFGSTSSYHPQVTLDHGQTLYLSALGAEGIMVGNNKKIGHFRISKSVVSGKAEIAGKKSDALVDHFFAFSERWKDTGGGNDGARHPKIISKFLTPHTQTKRRQTQLKRT